MDLLQAVIKNSEMDGTKLGWGFSWQNERFTIGLPVKLTGVIIVSPRAESQRLRRDEKDAFQTRFVSISSWRKMAACRVLPVLSGIECGPKNSGCPPGPNFRSEAVLMVRTEVASVG